MECIFLSLSKLEEGRYLRWPTTVTAKINTSRQKKITHGKRKLPTAKRKTSRQKEKPRGKKKNLAAKRKRLTAKRKRLTAKRKDSRKKEKLIRGKRKKTAWELAEFFEVLHGEKKAIKRGVIGLQDSYPMFSLAVLYQSLYRFTCLYISSGYVMGV